MRENRLSGSMRGVWKRGESLSCRYRATSLLYIVIGGGCYHTGQYGSIRPDLFRVMLDMFNPLADQT